MSNLYTRAANFTVDHTLHQPIQSGVVAIWIMDMWMLSWVISENVLSFLKHVWWNTMALTTATHSGTFFPALVKPQIRSPGVTLPHLSASSVVKNYTLLMVKTSKVIFLHTMKENCVSMFTDIQYINYHMFYINRHWEERFVRGTPATQTSFT